MSDLFHAGFHAGLLGAAYFPNRLRGLMATAARCRKT